MRILLTNSTDIFAGGEDYVLILATALRKRGHIVFVSANPGHLLLEKCEARGIPSHPLEYRGMGRVFTVAGQIRRFLKKQFIDIIHSNANYDRTCAALAAAGTGVHHVAGVHSAHSIQHNITHWWRNRFGTTHFIADADAVKDVLVKENSIPPSKLSVVPIGVENEDGTQTTRVREKKREELGISPETIVIGNVARLVPFKGHTVLLKAVKTLVASAPHVVVLIIGDGELQDSLQREVKKLGIGSHVRFLGFQDNLHEWYPAFDIYCHSSLELAAEAFPIAILRSLAAGLPAVCTNVGGIGMMIEEGVTGHLTAPEDSGALAAALLKVVQTPQQRISMGRAAHALFRRKFDAEVMASHVERIYSSLGVHNGA